MGWAMYMRFSKCKKKCFRPTERTEPDAVTGLITQLGLVDFCSGPGPYRPVLSFSSFDHVGPWAGWHGAELSPWSW